MSYSDMFHPKAEAGWKIKTWKTLISSPAKSHSPFLKGASLVSEAAGPAPSYTAICLRLQGKAVLHSWPRLQCVMLHERAACTFSWMLDSKTPFKMANAGLGEENRSRKGCSLMFLFSHTYTGSQHHPARKKVLLWHTADYFLLWCPHKLTYQSK